MLYLTPAFITRTDGRHNERKVRIPLAAALRLLDWKFATMQLECTSITMSMTIVLSWFWAATKSN